MSPPASLSHHEPGSSIMRCRNLPILTAGLFILPLLPVSPAFACFIHAPLPVHVWMDHIEVVISDQVAVKTYHCTFRNPNRRAVVGGTCYMELEPGAQVDDMSVLVDGVDHQAEILDVDKAKEVFADIVRRGGSPALLEYYGNQLIRTKVPRIEASGTVTVKLQYTTVLAPQGGVIRLQMLNTNPKALLKPLKSASVSVDISSRRPIKNVYSPTHRLKFEEKPGCDVSISWKQDNYLPRHPFVLYYQMANEQVGASLIAHRERGEHGSFMLLLSPTVGRGKEAVRDEDILPKDVVFCIDTSGSMLEADKMKQARGALKYCLENLHRGDRFNIVDFSTTARSLSKPGLLDFNRHHQRAALRYADELSARGGTAIGEALETSLQHIDRASRNEAGNRLKMILFATDGLPTVGETNSEKLVTAVAKRNESDARLFVFGEGYDVNTALLDFLALENRGETDYILPEEDIEDKISRFFDRVGSPVMTDIEIDFGELKAQEVYPRRIADIYRGEQVVIYGQYRGGGEHTITVSGNTTEGRESFEYTLKFPRRSDDDRNSFVHRLWAGRKIDYLLAEIRRQSTRPEELVNEVTRLAKRYGIVTPYTSFLMTDDVITRPQRRLTSDDPSDDPLHFRTRSLGAAPAADAQTRLRDVDAAKRLSDLRRASGRSGSLESLDESAEAALGGGFPADGVASGPFNEPRSSPDEAKRPESVLATLRSIGTRTFYSLENIWYESEFDPTQSRIARIVKVGSDEYIDLLVSDERLAKYFALGDVVLRVGDEWLRIEG
jgi:Ca-activated chloride channel homolog